MGIVEETGKMIEKRIYEAAEQARREHQTEWNELKKTARMAVFGGTYTVPQTDTMAMMEKREEWLEKTQHMRVVALNEACEVAKAHISCGESMAAIEITSMASLFAKFLVDNEA
jgi:hypothetical protein